MSFKAAVAGCTGYVGGEVLRSLLQHPEVKIGALAGNSSASDRLRDHRPHLAPLADREIVATTVKNLADHDVVLLALPHGTSAGITGRFGAETLIIDAGADFRLHDSGQWRRFYGSEHAGTWPYGLPELPDYRDALRGTGRVTVPGCYPTTITLALFPAVQAGPVDPAGVIVVAASEVSETEKAAKPHLPGLGITGSASVYGVSGVHQHIPEIIQNLSAMTDERVDVSFTPMLVPMPRGILTICITPRASDVAADEIRRCYKMAYADEPFVGPLPEGTWPATAGVLGSNRVTVQVAVDEAAGRVIVISTVDNLTKGTAGGAIQSMSIALGLDETTSLGTIGVAP